MKTFVPAVKASSLTILSLIWILTPLIFLFGFYFFGLDTEQKALILENSKIFKSFLHFLVLYLLMAVVFAVLILYQKSARLFVGKDGIKKTYDLLIYQGEWSVSWNELKKIHYMPLKGQLKLYLPGLWIPKIIAMKAWVEKGEQKSLSSIFKMRKNNVLMIEINKNLPEHLKPKFLKEPKNLGNLVKYLTFTSLGLCLIFVILLFTGGEIVLSNQFYFWPFSITMLSLFCLILVVLKDNFKSHEHVAGNLLVALFCSGFGAAVVGGLHDNFCKYMGTINTVEMQLEQIEGDFMKWKFIDKDWKQIELRIQEDFERSIPLLSVIEVPIRTGIFKYAQLNVEDFDRAIESFDSRNE